MIYTYKENDIICWCKKTDSGYIKTDITGAKDFGPVDPSLVPKPSNIFIKVDGIRLVND